MCNFARISITKYNMVLKIFKTNPNNGFAILINPQLHAKIIKIRSELQKIVAYIYGLPLLHLP